MCGIRLVVAGEIPQEHQAQGKCAICSNDMLIWKGMLIARTGGISPWCGCEIPSGNFWYSHKSCGDVV